MSIEGINAAVLAGTLSSDPRELELESGSRLLRLEITTRTDDGERADTVPVAWFDPPASAPVLATGDRWSSSARSGAAGSAGRVAPAARPRSWRQRVVPASRRRRRAPGARRSGGRHPGRRRRLRRPAHAVVTARSRSAKMERQIAGHDQGRYADEPRAAREGPDGRRLHRRTRPERRQHAEGAQAVRRRGGRVLQRRRDVRPHPRDADADHHEPELQRRPRPRGDPVREDDGPRDRRPRHRRLPVDDQGRRAVPQDRQGPRGRGRRRAADEADARPRRAAGRGRVGEGRVRHQGAVGRQARQRRRHRRRSSTSSSRSAARCSPPGSCRSSSPRSTSTARRRPRPRRCSRRRSSRASRGSATASRSCSSSRCPTRTASTPTSSSTRRCSRSWRLSGGYSRDEANERLARNQGVIASFSRALTEGLSAQQSDEEFDAALDEAIKSIYEASIA